MRYAIDVGLPLLVMLAMTVVGLELTLEDSALSWNREDTVTLVAAFPSRGLSIATAGGHRY